MIRIKAGENVRVTDRKATPQDAKSGLFFEYYGGLTGTVQKIYGGGEVAVSIDRDSLPEDVWLRHMSARDRMRDAWLGGLSDEARRKLTPEQKRFELSYVILVSQTDLERPRPTRAKRAA
jgi:hypothetical protein